MQNVTPHWGWFLLAPGVLVLGGIAAGVLLVSGIMSVADGMQRVDIPGEQVVHVEEAGDQTIFFEQQGMTSDAPPGLVLEITPANGGSPLSLQPSPGNFSYNVNGTTGRDFRKVTFPTAGDYKFAATVPPGSTTGKVAFGGNPAEKLVGTLIGFFAIGGLSFVLAVVILIVLIVRRSSCRKRLQQQQYTQLQQGGLAAPPGGL